MTLDEAIHHCLEVAEEQELSLNDKEMYSEMLGEDYSGFEEGCQECATEHRQLAEWLTDLKEAKRLLMLALNDFETIESNLEYDEQCVIKTHSIRCDECPLSSETIFRCKWRYADEVLALIGDESNGI